MITWKAEITLDGVPSVTVEQYEEIYTYCKGVLRHEADTEQVFLVWRFEDPDITAALCDVSAVPMAVALVLGGNPVCTDVHVYQVPPNEGAEIS